MHRITNTGRVNLGHLFWLRTLAIIGLEVLFNALTWVRVARARPETNMELFGQIWVDLGALSALLFLSGGTTNPFVSLYLPSLAIAGAVCRWHFLVCVVA